MTNTYQATSEYGVAVYGEDEFDADFTALEERDLLEHLMIVPSAYTVLSDNYAGGAQGDTVWLALPVETEAALISGGHLEPVEEPAEEPVNEPAAPPAEEEEEV